MASMAAEWRAATAPNGRQYFYNRAGTTVWDSPPRSPPRDPTPANDSGRKGGGLHPSDRGLMLDRARLQSRFDSAKKREERARLEAKHRHQLANLQNRNNMLARSLRVSRGECRRLQRRQRSLLQLLQMLLNLQLNKNGKDGAKDNERDVWCGGLSPRDALSELRAIAQEMAREGE